LSFSRLLENLPALCNMVRRVAVEAGDKTLDYFEESGFMDAEKKNDGSPVTEADRAAEKVIKEALKDILPDVPMIGEESVDAGIIPDLKNAEYFWMVDPLDGTKEFISGSGDYTVNIALIHKQEPVMGVVYAPLLGDLYAGSIDGGAVRWNEESQKEKPIKVRPAPKEGMTIVASRRHGSAAEMDSFLEDYKIAKVIRRGSSLKICAIAAGKADLYPRFGPTCEWDTAAGDAVLRAAGGVICNEKGKPFTYGHADRKFLNGNFIACTNAFQETLITPPIE